MPLSIYKKYEQHITIALFIIFTIAMFWVMHPGWFA